MSVSRAGCVKNDYEIAELGLASEARISERVPIRCLAKLSYETQDGSSKTIKVRVVNMSASEVLIEALKPLPVATQVRIQARLQPLRLPVPPFPCLR
jgi:hypothetical protein